MHAGEAPRVGRQPSTLEAAGSSPVARSTTATGAPAHPQGMSIDMQPRQPAGAPTGGQFAATARAESTVSLVASVSPETRQAILDDLENQERRMILRLETLREDAERIEHEQAGVLRGLEELRERIADVAAAARQDVDGTDRDQATGPTPYQGPDHVDDVVEVEGYGTFHRRRPGVYPNQPYQVRIQLGRELEPGEEHHLAQLVGYAYSRTGGERLGEPFRDAPNSVVLYMDTTKGRAYQHLQDRFEDDLEQMVQDGSPIRRTDRAGAGTAGTRAVEGLGCIDGLHVYYDSVTS